MAAATLAWALEGVAYLHCRRNDGNCVEICREQGSRRKGKGREQEEEQERLPCTFYSFILILFYFYNSFLYWFCIFSLKFEMKCN